MGAPSVLKRLPRQAPWVACPLLRFGGFFGGPAMSVELSDEEERFIKDVMKWDETRRRTETLFSMLFLIVGGAVIVVVAYVTVGNLTDRTALSVTVPGFLAGILLIGLYLVAGWRIRERRTIASVLKKLRVGS
jgi:hypothetical protein